ncbi:hypothetical protein RND81_04G170300 [Saponaria officinalis]|uniref:Myb/SANT-like domain-containing protein n=1 Tax=Saponaria officinalis TaxID=3572 RepID=A0AAW1LF17_SAPOF
MTQTEVSNDKISPRRWTVEEDTLLVDLLLSLHVDGKWKAEGGFMSGYLVHLEKLISEKMPDAGLRANNIDSRLGYLKKRFNALLEIKQKGSGFGWDESQKMVTGDRKIFDEWLLYLEHVRTLLSNWFIGYFNCWVQMVLLQSHKDAKGIFRKLFPLFDAMEEIYSKDRATGVRGNMPLDRDDQDGIKETSENAQEDDLSVDVSTEGSGSSKRNGDGSSSQPRKKKSRKNKEIQNMQKSFENLLGTMLENSNAQIAQLTAMLEEPKNYKIGLRQELGMIEGITRNNVLTLCMKMAESDVAIFRDLNDEDEKFDFLAMVLSRP